MTAINVPQEQSKLVVVEEPQDHQEKSWIELNFRKRECSRFLPLTSLSNECLSRCKCGRLYSDHHFLNSHLSGNEEDVLPLGACAQDFAEKSSFQSDTKKFYETNFTNSYGDGVALSKPKFDDKWNVNQHTCQFPTDAHGTLEFQGTGEGDKSKYIRLSHDTEADLVLKLLHDEWKLNEPKMVITVHGGAHNFQLQPKLYRVFCNGLIKAAKTTGAWLMTCGLNTGVGQIVGNALKEHKMRSRGKIVSIGIAPWGVVDHREDLIGSQQISSYQTMENPLSKGSVLHTAHTHFLLVDNGTEGKYDTELRFRRQLEKKLSLQSFHPRHSRTSVVCLVLEGGKNTINVVLESVRQSPPIPVIVCDGSGRAADLLAFAHQYIDDDGTMMEELKVQLLALIQDTFKCNRDQAQYFYLSIMDCVRRKDLITVFRMGQNCSHDDIDIAILTASLKARSASAPDMLNLALSWNRIDIAKSQIFVYGRKWPVLSLDQAMLDALIGDRVDFVKLLMENGVSMHKFLTVTRLEELYNAKPPVHLVYLINDVKKHIPPGYRFNLIDIGLVIELLMGGAYRSNYTRKKFRLYYAAKERSETSVKKQFSLKKGLKNNFANSTVLSKTESFIAPLSGRREIGSPQSILPHPHFLYPFHDLMIWAVLMKRQKMALFMWQQGEEAIAKALVASKLYKMMAKEASDSDLDVEDSDQLRSYSKEFQDLAIQLLEICYHADDEATQHLLTYELKQWSRQTCLSLAVSGMLRDFIAHRCVQLLINDLWTGGLNERKNASLKVIMGILLPPTILKLDFKTHAELQLMPQTVEEHMHEVSSLSTSFAGSDASSSDSSSSSSSSESLASVPKLDVLGRTGLNSHVHDVYSMITSRPKQIALSKKIYEFYNAPITKFWMFALTFVTMLLLFSYVCLVRLEKLPSVYEWIVISYVTTFAIEKVREIVVSEPSDAVQKVKVWFSQFWNLVDSITIILFFFGLGFRLSRNPYFFEIGKVFYGVDIAFWYIHLLNIFSVNKHLGPYIMLMGKMMIDMFTFIILFFIVLCSFGVSRQSLLHPNRNASFSIMKDVFLEPYFMLYGEVYAGTIDPCSPENKDELCVTGSWIVPVFMTIYLLVANILLINLLIAVFNNTFARGKNYSDRIWRFQRYLAVVEYELRPVFPPPIILVSYLVMILRRIFKKRKVASLDRGLKLFLDDDDVEKLHDFEEDCVDEYLRCKDKEEKANTNNKSQENFELVIDNLDEIRQRYTTLTNHILDVHERIAGLETKFYDMYRPKSSPRSRRNTGGLSDPWSVPEDQVHNPFQVDPSQPVPSRALLALRRRRRKRQDSELSTISDWHQHNSRFSRNMSHDPVKLTPFHNKASKSGTSVKKSNSTGFLCKANPFNRDSGGGFVKEPSEHSQLPIEQSESKAQSCLDLMLVNLKKENNFEEHDDFMTKLSSTDQLKSSLSPSHETHASGSGDSDTDKSSPPSIPEAQSSSQEATGKRTVSSSVFDFSNVPLQTGPDVHNSCSNLQASRPLVEASLPRNKSFTGHLSGGRKFTVTTPTISIPTSPAMRSTYQSITDQIDTTRWHEVYDPKVPSTPFDNWGTGKSIDFDFHRHINPDDPNSCTDGEVDGDAGHKKKGRTKHRKREKRIKKQLSELTEVSSNLQINSNNNHESFFVKTSTFPRPRKNAFSKLEKSKFIHNSSNQL